MEQYLGLDWNLVARGVFETLVMLGAALWLLLGPGRGLWAVVGSVGALGYAGVVGTLTGGVAMTRSSGVPPGWLTTLYEHAALTDWTRVVCLLLVVVAFVMVRRRPSTAGLAD